MRTEITKATEHEDVLLKSAVNFFRNGLGGFVLNLHVKQFAEGRVWDPWIIPRWGRLVLFWRKAIAFIERLPYATKLSHVFLNSYLGVEGMGFYIKGKGRFWGNFPLMTLMGGIMPSQQVLEGKFKVNYLIELERKGTERFVCFYPTFFPGWLGSIDFFEAITDVSTIFRPVYENCINWCQKVTPNIRRCLVVSPAAREHASVIPTKV